MTTVIHDIADFVRVLQEHPEWLSTVRAIVVGDELLSLPQQLAEFIAATNENFRLVNERLDRLESQVGDLQAGQARLESQVGDLQARQARLESQVGDFQAGQARLESQVGDLQAGQANLQAGQAELQAGQANLQAGQAELQAGQANLQAGQAELQAGHNNLQSQVNNLSGRVGNLEGSDFERKSRNRVLFRAQDAFNMDLPVIAMVQEQQSTPEFNRLMHQARRAGRISPEQQSELLEADMIISDGDSQHIVVEASITASIDDINRAGDRAAIMASASGVPCHAVIAANQITNDLREHAAANNVTTFVLNRT